MSFKPDHFTVWAEIPVSDLDRSMTFYGDVFQLDLQKDETGPNPMAMFPTKDPANGIAGHLYVGKPSGDGGGPTVHFASPDTLEDALSRVKEAGGQVLSDPITIPAGRFAYCLDLDGNSIGVFSR
ncbi:MAG: VOC family protein [Pseudomonadota bacterium]